MEHRRYFTEFYSETCCDECYEIIHTHFNCPSCKYQYAETSVYGDINDGDTFTCERCGKTFKRLTDKEIEEIVENR